MNTASSDIPGARYRLETVVNALECGLIMPETAAKFIREEILPRMVRKSTSRSESE